MPDVILSGEKPVYPAAGQGEVDYPHYVRLLRDHGVDALVIEHVTEENFAPVRDFLRGVMRDQPRMDANARKWGRDA